MWLARLFTFACKILALSPGAHVFYFCWRAAAVYGVADRIEFIVGDFMRLASTLKVSSDKSVVPLTNSDFGFCASVRL